MDPLSVIHVLLFSILAVLILVGIRLMASFQAIADAQAATAQAIADLAARVGNQSGITLAQSDQLLENELNEKLAIESILP